MASDDYITAVPCSDNHVPGKRTWPRVHAAEEEANRARMNEEKRIILHSRDHDYTIDRYKSIFHLIIRSLRGLLS